MLLTRPNHLIVQRRDRPEFSLDDLLQGGAGVLAVAEWVALAPHLSREVLVDLADLAVLDAMPAQAVERATLEDRFTAERIARLVDEGLLIGDHAEHAQLRACDQALRDTAWWTPAAVAHAFGRWQGMDIAANEARDGKRTLGQLIALNGPPPAETIQLRPRESWQPLARPEATPLDTLMAARSTCRNFDRAQGVCLHDLGQMLHRVFGAQARQALSPEASILKKNSPSGGGLHPIEAYLLVQRVAGLPPGLYHYQCVEHALEPLQLLEPAQLAGCAHDLVAGQRWFADAPVLVLMAARFQRTFWKYRNHAKAWRVVQLDAGHLSQTFYLSATEQGHGAFITGAINDRCAETLFELDGLSTGAIAVCGFGPRGGDHEFAEFDPLGKAAR